MTSAVIAVLISGLALAFVEGLGHFYPAKKTWWRLRSTHGRKAVRAMRERVEAMASRRTPSLLAEILLGLLVVWVAISPLLDKRWYEVIADVLPWVVVGVALYRTPTILGAIGERMREYEKEVGEDPDADVNDLFDGPGDGGPSALAL
mgnify:CR=1 FL=1